jgi:hypothetical protein
MANFFETIPIRSNSTKEVVDSDWFNTIRTRLVLFYEEYIGGGSTPIASQEILNDASSWTPIAALEFSLAVGNSFDVEYFIRRDTTTDVRVERGTLTVVHNGLTWELSRAIKGGSDSLNMPESMRVNAGVLEYQSDDMSPIDPEMYSGSITFKIVNVFKAP